MASCALQRQSVVRIHIAAAPYQILRICCTDAAIMVNWQCILLHRLMAHARHTVHRLAGMPMSPFPGTQEGMADTIYSGYMAESAPPLAVVQAVLAQSLPASGATLPTLHMHQCLLNHAPFAARSSQPAAGLDAALGRAFNTTGNANCEQPSSAVCLQPHNQTVELGAAPLLNTAPLLGREQLLGGAPSLGGALLQGGVPLLGRSSLLAESEPTSQRRVLSLYPFGHDTNTAVGVADEVLCAVPLTAEWLMMDEWPVRHAYSPFSPQCAVHLGISSPSRIAIR